MVELSSHLDSAVGDLEFAFYNQVAFHNALLVVSVDAKLILRIDGTAYMLRGIIHPVDELVGPVGKQGALVKVNVVGIPLDLEFRPVHLLFHLFGIRCIVVHHIQVGIDRVSRDDTGISAENIQRNLMVHIDALGTICDRQCLFYINVGDICVVECGA